MSVGGLVGGFFGGVVGFFIGGPMGAIYGAGLGLGVGTMLDPMTPDMNVAGRPMPESLQMVSTIGDPCPDLAGTGEIVGHLLFYGDERSEEIYSEGSSGGKGGVPSQDPQVTGFNYYMSWAVGICRGPIDSLLAIYKNEDLLWEGPLELPESGGEESIVIEDFGTIVFYFGTTDQLANTKAGEIIGDATLNSPLRNYCWAFMDDCFIGNYPRTPSLRFILKKIPTNPFSTRDTIQDYDCNPMHVQYYILNTLAGLPSTWLNSADFAAVASTLNDEYRGISVVFKEQGSALSYIQNINNHIDALTRYGSDGALHPKLIRDDYDVDSIPVIEEDQCLVDISLLRPSWIDTINETKVQFSEMLNVDRPKIVVGTVFATGFGGSGRLSTGDYFNKAIMHPSVSTELFRVVMACPSHSLAIKEDKTLWGCGYAYWYAYGIIPDILSIWNLISSERWNEVFNASIGTFAIKEDGTLWATGLNTFGQMGVGHGDVIPGFIQVGTETNWLKIASGYSHTMAIKTDGTLWACGNGTSFRLGLRDLSSRYTFTQVGIHDDDPPELASGWTDVAVGFGTSYALRGSTMWVVGENVYGQCGLGLPDDFVSHLTPVPGAWTSLTASVGAYHVCAMSGNSVYMCGKGTAGALGLGNFNNVSTFTNTGLIAKKVALGLDFTVMLDFDGAAWGTGMNQYGQLGRGTYDSPFSTFVKMELPEPEEGDGVYVDISAGEIHTLAISKYV